MDNVKYLGHNKDFSWCEPDNKNTWDRYEVESIQKFKFQSLWPFEKPGIILKFYVINPRAEKRGNYFPNTIFIHKGSCTKINLYVHIDYYIYIFTYVYIKKKVF